jgi:hypothetical protein
MFVSVEEGATLAVTLPILDCFLEEYVGVRGWSFDE